QDPTPAHRLAPVLLHRLERPARSLRPDLPNGEHLLWWRHAHVHDEPALHGRRRAHDDSRRSPAGARRLLGPKRFAARLAHPLGPRAPTHRRERLPRPPPFPGIYSGILRRRGALRRPLRGRDLLLDAPWPRLRHERAHEPTVAMMFRSCSWASLIRAATS